MVEIGRQQTHGSGTGLPIGQRPQTEPDVGHSGRPGKDPPVAGERVPRGRFPQRDGREGDGLVQIAPHREPPQHPGTIDQPGTVGHVAGGAVGTNDEVGVQLVAVDGETVQLVTRPQRTVGPTADLDGAGIEGRGTQGIVELHPGHCPGAARIGQPVHAGQDDPASVRTDHHHVADIEAGRLGHPEVGEDLEAFRSDEVATGLVPWEACLVEEGHGGAGPRQDEGRDAPGRTRSDHQHVDAPRAHNSPLGR